MPTNKTQKNKTAVEIFIIKLQALYDIENVIIKALPKMEKVARDPELKNGFRVHMEETQMHIERLENAFLILGQPAKKLKCDGIRGIIDDGNWMASVPVSDMLRDALLASAARHVEHYEMAGYMSAIAEAEALGQSNIVDLLRETLEEEEETDKKLALAAEKSLELEAEETENETEEE